MNLLEKIHLAKVNLEQVVEHTPLIKNANLSEEFSANIFLKREDLQVVRSYKIRGAYNKMVSMEDADKRIGIVCASAGNHAQGVAYSCKLLEIHGIIFMPVTTSKQKIKQVKFFGKEKVEIILMGDTYDDCYDLAVEYSTINKKKFIHPFDDELVIAGQGTVGLEILEANKDIAFDYIFIPIGGGGLAAGVSTVFKKLSPNTKIIGIEPLGAPSMKTSIQNGINTKLENINSFVDGAAVKKVGDKTFEICKNILDYIILVPEGKICTTILRLYNEEAMIVEPAGALTIAALDFYKHEIRNKNVVCIVSGSNNDINRIEEIKELAFRYNTLFQ